MMPSQCSLISKLAVLVLLGTVRASPFSSRSNKPLPTSRPPPQPGGRPVEPKRGNPSSQLYEHIVEGGQKQVVFTHRINLPPSTGCGCPPGTEPPVPASEVQALRVRLEILEELVKGLKEQRTGGCCPVAAQAGTGQTDIRSLCSLHGVFDLNRCACLCKPGWGGPTCSDPTDTGVLPSSPPSAFGSCPDDCNDQGRCVLGRCVCFPGYTGPSCGWPSCPGDCHGHGRCVQGVCVCRTGFLGDDCSLRSCPGGCSQKGRCEDGRCVCDPGYTGEDCGVRSCPRGCSQKGRCEDGRCVCDPGYAGEDCGSQSCPLDCGEGGRCVDGRCVCRPGYAGENCGTRTCPRDCRGRGSCEDGECICDAGYSGEDCGTRACRGDCRGRGRCVDGRCVCNPGFMGQDCGSRRCPGDCRGRGRCEDGVCACDTGYEGEDCSARSCPGSCRGHGQCLDGLCVCDDGYSGHDCGERRCPRDCSQRGVCQDGVCTCWEGYAGEDCALRTCPFNCHGRGRCEDGRCVCNSGYTGPFCASRACPADCRGRGHCVQGACVCRAGYSGEDCGQETPPASACPGGCGPRELCQAGQCVCVEGFRGPDCAIQTCPGDCRGRGECREGRCVCQDGYAGADCGEEVPAIEGMRMHLLEETTVRTEWTRAPGPVNAYEIQFIPTTEGASPPFMARVPSTASAYDQRGLAPGQEYQVTVRALRGTNWGPPASKTITTMIDGPQDLRVVAMTPTTLELSWLRPQAEVDQFVVSYVSAGNQRVRLVVPSEADGTVLTDLMPGVEYVVTVTAERGRAVSYPASVRANTAPGHYSYPEVHPPALSPKPRPRPAPAPQPRRPARPARLPRPAEERHEESGPRPSLPRPSRRPWGNLTAELSRFRGTAQDLERHLRAHRYPLRANQTYTSVARRIHEYLQRRLAAATAGSHAPPPGPSHPTTSPDSDTTWKRDSNQGIYSLSPEGVDRVAAPRHSKPEVLGSSADGALLVSLDGLRGHFEHVVLRWQPQPPAGGPLGELTVPGTTRTVSIPDLRPGTTYRVEVHGVRAGQTSKSYAFITTTGSFPSGLLVATGEPPSSAYSTTQGAQAPGLQQRPRQLGELRVLGRDKTGHLRVAWTAQPDTFAHFQLRLWVPDGAWAHEELLPGDVRQALVPSPPPGKPYELSLRGVPPEAKPSAPLIYQGIMDRDEEKPGKSLVPPRLGELTVGDVTSNSLLLHWTIPEGTFDSFVIQYKDRDGPQVVPVEGPQRSALITNLDMSRKYKFLLYGLEGKKKHGPLVAEAKIVPQRDPRPATPPRLGMLWVTDPSPDSLHLSWTVPEGQFDSFVVQYRDRDGWLQMVPVEGPERSVIVSPLDPEHKYRFSLFGIANKKRHGPLTADGTTAPEKREEPRPPDRPLQPLLGEVTVTGSTPGSLRLSWSVAQGNFDSFLVQYKDAQGQPQAVPVSGDENEVTVPGLASDRKYEMNLYGFLGRKRVGPVSVVATTARQEVVEETLSPTEPSTEASEPPEEPVLGELMVTGSSPDSLSLSWTVPQGHFDSFTVQYKDTAGRPQVVRVGGEESEVTVRGLEPGRKYKMHLYGLHGGQREGPVSTVGLTAPQEEAPASPALKPQLGELTVMDATTDTLHLSWTVPEGQFDHFLVQYKNGAGQPQVVRVPGHKDAVTISGLEPDHKYKMNLYGFHDGLRQGPISAVGFTASGKDQEMTPTPTDLPTMMPEPSVKPRLGELAVTEATPNSLSLSWTVPEGQFDHFLILYENRDGHSKAVRRSGQCNRVTISHLEPDHKYNLTLYAYYGTQRQGPMFAIGVTAPFPTERSTEAPDSPEEPVLGELMLTGSSPDSLSLSWTVPQGHFDSFTVQYKDTAGRPQVVRIGGEESEVTVRGLEPGRKYKMHLYGLHGGRREGPVSTVGLTAPQVDVGDTPFPTEPSTEAPEPTEEPVLGELMVTGSSPDSLSLSWTIPQGHFDSFTVQYKDTAGRPQVVRVGGEESEVTVWGLEPGRKYKMHLYGLHGGRREGPVSTVGLTDYGAVTTQAPPTMTPEPPVKPRLGELEVTDATPNSLRLSWTVPEGQFDHFLVQYKNGDGKPKVVRVPGHQEEVTIWGLEPDHKYKMNLYGFHDNQRQGPVSAIGVTAAGEETPFPTEPSTEAPEPTEEPVLGELMVTGSSPDSLSLSWTVPQGHFDSFTVQYKDTAGRPQVVRVGGEESEVTVRGLEPGRKYKMHLYGLHGGRREGPVSTVGLTDYGAVTTQAPPTMTPEPPVKPRLGELEVTDATPNSLRLSWTVPEGQFDHFLVQYKNGDGKPKVVRVPGHQEEVTIWGLEPDHKYKMNLYGFHDNQRQGPVSAIGVTAAGEETPFPTEPSTEAPEPTEEPVLGELMVTGSSPDSLSLSWTVPQGHFDSFTVQYKDTAGRPQVVRVGGEESEVTVRGLEPGRKYKMHLYGLHGGRREGPVSTVGLTDYGAVTTQAPPTMTPEPPVKPRLGELEVTDATPNSLRLSWTVPEGQFDHFLVQYKNGDGKPKVVRVPGHQEEVTIWGLEPDHKYKMNLYGFHDNQRQGPVSAIGVTAAGEETPFPTEPSTEAPEPTEEPVLGELMVTGSSPDSLSLSWTVPQGHFDSFTVQYKDTAGRPQVVRVGGEESEVTVRGLEPGRKYKMHLYGLHGGRREGPVSTVGLTDYGAVTTQAPPTMTPEPPVKPRLGELEVTDATPNSLRLSWTVPEGQFDHFLVQYKNGDGKPKVVRVPGHQEEVTIWGLEPDHKYKMNLYGFHDNQRQGPVSAIGVTAAGEETPFPTEPSTEAPEPTEEPVLGELMVTGSSPDSLSLSWTVPQGHFDSFTVQYKDTAGRPQVVRVGGEESEVTVRGLEPGRKYKMHLYGLHGGRREGPVSTVGLTDYGAVTTQAPPTMTPEPPVKPRLGELEVTDATPNSLRLSWTVPEGQFDHFLVQYKNGDGKPKVVRVPGHQEEVTIWGLEPDHKYKMNLYGFHDNQRQGPVSAIGVTAAGEETPFPTEPSTEAPEPTEEPVLGELMVTGSSPDSLSLSWTVPQGHFDSFTVQYKDTAGRPQVVRVGGEESEVTVRGLEPGRKYKMHLYGLHGGRREGPVSTVGLTDYGAVTTQAPPTMTPEPPVKPRLGELEVTDATPNSLRLSWTVPEGQFDHFLVQYKNGDGKPKVVRVPGHQEEVTIWGLEPDHKYKMNLYGFHDNQRQGPVSAIGVTAAGEETPFPTEPSTEAPEPTEEPVLGELMVTGSSPDSLSLSWTVPQGHFDSFTVQYKDTAGRPQVVRVGGEESEVTVRGLEPGRKYKMHLYGLHGGRREGPVSTVGLTDYGAVTTQAPPTMTPEPPVKPRLGELEVTDATPNSLRLSWTVPEGQFDHFLVQYKNGDGKPKVVRVPGHQEEVTIWGLEPDHKYKMNLYGFHDNQRQGPVSAIGVTAAGEETPFPTEPSTEAPEPTEEPVLGELMVTGSSPDSLSLSWTVPQGHFDSFTVQYKDTAGRPQVVRVGGEESEVTVRGLEPGRKYKMHLYGLHGGRREGPVSTVGLTDYGAVTTQAPPTMTPEPPVKPRLGELEVTDATPNSLRLSWTVPEGQFDHFLVQYKNGDGKPKVVRVPGHQEEVTIWGLEPDHKYKMNLYGFHDNQRQGPVSAIGVTAAGEETPFPTEPSTEAPEPTEEPVLGELMVTGSSPDSLSLSWTVPQGHFDSFTVQYKDTAGRPQVVRVGGEESEVTVRGLEPGRKYKMHLYGLHGVRHVGPISTVGLTASLPTKPPVTPRLGELAVAAVTSDTVHLSWTVAQGVFESFLDQYRDVQGQPQAVPVGGELRKVNISSLVPARKYKFLLLNSKMQKDTAYCPWTQRPYKDRNEQPHVVPVAADQLKVTISDLAPNTKYKFLLYGLAGRKQLGPISAEGTTAPVEKEQQPSPHLGELMVMDETPHSLHLSWTVAKGPFDSFVVQYWDTNGQPQALLVGGDQSKVLVSGLEPSTPYKFFLYGLREGKRLGPVSAQGTTGSAPAGQTAGDRGPRLSHLSVTDVTTSSLRLNWEAPPGAFDSFLLRYGVPSPSTLELHPRPLLQRELTVPGTRQSAMLRDLHPGTLYSLTLYGLRGPHKADSLQGTAHTLSPILQSPRDLQFSEIGETSAKVSWMPPPSRVDSFKVSYQLADGGEPQSMQVDGRAGTQKLRGLIPGARYEVTVVSVRGFEESEPLTGFLITVPDGPTQLRALNLTEGNTVLHWKPPQAPVDTYDIQVTASGAPPLQASAPGSAVAYPLHGLMLHTNYTATVHGLRGPNLTSPASIVFTTGLEGPLDLEAKEVTPRTALLTWIEPQVPPTGYLLTYNTSAGQTQILLPGGATSHQLLGLFPSTTYKVWLWATWGESLAPPMSTSFTTGGLRVPFPRDCGEEMQNGPGTSRTTTIFLNGNREQPLNVFCDMETDGGGWLVFQRRLDGHTDFWRDWQDYAHGFGNISSEFWLGNEALHSLTKAGDYSMRVDLRAGDEAVFAHYDSFRVDSAAGYYRLHLEGYHGTAGDSMSYHSGSVFSARDRDPNNLLISCAVSYRGAWWYRNCHYANLNGLYGSTVDHQGVSWYHWKGFEFSVPFTEMKLRPRSYRAPA